MKLSACVVAITFAVCSASVAASHLKHLLFYTCATKEVLNQCEESFTLDQNESANLGFTSNLTTAVDGFHNANMRTLYAVHDVFFANGQGMQPDYLARWEHTKTLLRPLIEQGVVVGFFIGDELFPGKISVQNLTTALSLVTAFKQEFPSPLRDSLLTWENEGGTSWVDYVNHELGGKLPADLDVFSIDDYSMSVEDHREFHEKTIYPMLHPHQRVWLVPGLCLFVPCVDFISCRCAVLLRYVWVVYVCIVSTMHGYRNPHACVLHRFSTHRCVCHPRC